MPLQHTPVTYPTPKTTNWPMIVLIAVGVVVILGVVLFYAFDINKSDISSETESGETSGAGTPLFNEDREISWETEGLDEDAGLDDSDLGLNNSKSKNAGNNTLIYYRCNEEGTGVVATGNVIRYTGYATSGTFSSKVFLPHKHVFPQDFPFQVILH